MDNKIIQACLWQDVIKLGFSPGSDKEKKSWLVQYAKSLKDFWEIDGYPPNPKLSNNALVGELTSSISINMLLEYFIKDISSFAVRFLHINNTRELMWTHEVDCQYFAFPEQSILNKYGKRNQISESDISKHTKAVLDGLLFHPQAHQHIESPIDKHEIRIGGGINNVFVFLFHLRYQLCPDDFKRNEEKNRLIELFETAIKRKNSITANELLG